MTTAVATAALTAVVSTAAARAAICAPRRQHGAGGGPPSGGSTFAAPWRLSRRRAAHHARQPGSGGAPCQPRSTRHALALCSRIAKCLGHAHADCQVTRVPLPAAAPSAAKKGGGGLFSRSRTATSKSFAPALADASSEPAAPTYDAVESIELPVESPTAD